MKIAPNKQPDLIPHKNKPVPIQGICHLVENIRFKKMWNFGLPPWSKQVQTFELFLTKQQYLSELLTDAHHAESTHLGASADEGKCLDCALMSKGKKQLSQITKIYFG